MTHASNGTLQGNVITLDEAPPPDLSTQGYRVRVIVEPLLPAEEQQRRLREWAERGPQGPIEEMRGFRSGLS